MCKGTIEEHLCTLGLSGDVLCPWRDPLSGYVTPYLCFWRDIWECCGDHTSDCSDCPLAYDDVAKVQVWSLECEECKARIQPAQDAAQAERLAYLEKLDRRRRIALPRLQAEIDAGKTNLTLEELLWGDGSLDESLHVTRVVWEAEVEEMRKATLQAEEAAAAQEGESSKSREARGEEEDGATQGEGEERHVAQGSGTSEEVNFSDWLVDDDEEE